jgi:hypothetical protein
MPSQAASGFGLKKNLNDGLAIVHRHSRLEEHKSQ